MRVWLELGQRNSSLQIYVKGAQARLTEHKCKHIREGPRGVEQNVELASLEQSVPPSSWLAKGLLNFGSEDQKRRRAEEAQDSPHDELRMPEACQVDKRLRKAGKKNRPNESPGNGTREVEVIVSGRETAVNVCRRRAVHQDIMGGLDIERLLDLSVRSDDEMQDDQCRKGQRQQGIQHCLHLDT